MVTASTGSQGPVGGIGCASATSGMTNTVRTTASPNRRIGHLDGDGFRESSRPSRRTRAARGVRSPLSSMGEPVIFRGVYAVPLYLLPSLSLSGARLGGWVVGEGPHTPPDY